MAIIGYTTLITRLEREREEFILSGLIFSHDARKDYDILSRKLNKLYSWYAKAYIEGRALIHPYEQYPGFTGEFHGQK